MLEKLIKHSSSNLYYLLFLFLGLGFYSCEYDSNDFNYVHLEKPKEEMQMGIDLAGVNPLELIYISNQSTFTYSLFTNGHDILFLEFFLDGIPIESNQQTGVLYLDRSITDNKIHELKLVIAFKTGTGSLAEYAKYETYAGEYIFKIKMFSFSNNLNIRETINSNNNLKIEWDKPLNYEVTGYKIYKGDNRGELLASINNPNETYFIDTDYAYGYKPYTIVAEIKNSFNLSVQDHLIVNYSNMTEKDFETRRISKNEISIKWKNPNLFPCKYVLTYGFNKEKKIIEDGVNEVVIPANDFPRWSESFSLYILPKTADINRYESYSNALGAYSDKIFNAICINYNLKSNILQGLNFKTLDNYNISNMERVISINHNLNIDTGCKVQVSKDGKVAIEDSKGFVHVYADHSLKNKITSIEAGIYPFQIINNDKLFIEERGGFKIYDITTNNVICSKLWKSDFINGDIATNTCISPDGIYLYVRCNEFSWANPNKQWVELYEIDSSNTLKLLETVTNTHIESIQFHPIKNNEAIFQYSPYDENKFVIHNIITKEKKEIKGEFMNIDPFTGNLLFRGEEYRENDYNVYVLDKYYKNEKINIKLANVNPLGESYLYNNNLFFYNCYLDLYNLKEWNK